MNNSYIVAIVGDDNDYISHHGVLGMHWGYRKAEVSSPRRSSSGLGDTSKAASSLSQWGRRYKAKTTELRAYNKETGDNMKHITGLGQKFIYAEKRHWNAPAMKVLGADGKWGEEYVKGAIIGTGVGIGALKIAGLI